MVKVNIDIFLSFNGDIRKLFLSEMFIELSSMSHIWLFSKLLNLIGNQ